MVWGKALIVLGLTAGIGFAQALPERFTPPSQVLPKLEEVITQSEPSIPIEQTSAEMPVNINGRIEGAEESKLLRQSLKALAWVTGKYALPSWASATKLDASRIYLLKKTADDYFAKYPLSPYAYFEQDKTLPLVYFYLLPEINSFLWGRAEKYNVREEFAMFPVGKAKLLDKIENAIEAQASQNGDKPYPKFGAVANGAYGHFRVPTYMWTYENGKHLVTFPTDMGQLFLETMNSLTPNEQRDLSELYWDLLRNGGTLSLSSGDVKVVFQDSGYTYMVGPFQKNF